MLGGIIEKTRLGGEQVANGIKTVIARIYQSKSIDENVTDDDMSKTSAMLSKLGVAVKDVTTGAFRPLNDILKDVKNAEDGMTDSQKSALNGQAAGIRQLNIFQTALDTVNKTQLLTNDAINSNGELLSANSKYMDTASAKIKVLGASLNSMWQGMISSQSIKSLLDDVNALVSTFGNLKTIVSLVATGLLVFKGTEILSFVKNLQLVRDVSVALQLQEMGLLTVNDLLSISFTTLGNSIKTAMISNPLGWIALGITAVVMATDAIQNINKAIQDHIDKVNKEESVIKSNQDNLKTLGDTYKDLSSKTSLSTDESKKLTDTQNQLVTQFPNLLGYYDAEGNAHIKNSGAINDEVKALNDEYIAKEKLKTQDYLQQIEEETKKIANLKNLIAQRYITDSEMGINPATDANMQKFEDGIKQSNTAIKGFEDNIKSGITEFASLSGVAKNVGIEMANNFDKSFGTVTQDNLAKYQDGIKNIAVQLQSSGIQKGITDYQNLENGYKNGTVTLVDLKTAYDTLYNTLNKILGIPKSDISKFLPDITQVDNATTKIQSLSDVETGLATTLSTDKASIDEVNQLLDKHAKSGEWDYDTIIKLAKSYPELLGKLGDEKSLEAELIKIKGDKITATQTSLNTQIKLEVDYINQLTQGYNFDINNFKTAQEAKDALTKSGVNKRIQMYNDEANAAVAAANAATNATARDNAIRGAMYAGEMASAASSTMTSVSTAIDAYFGLKTLSANATSLLNNAGSSGYDGKSPKSSSTPTSTAETSNAIELDKYSAIIDITNDKLKNMNNTIDITKQKITNYKALGTDDGFAKSITEENNLLTEQNSKLTLLKSNQTDLDNGLYSTVDHMQRNFAQVNGINANVIEKYTEQDFLNLEASMFPTTTWTGKEASTEKAIFEARKKDFETSYKDILKFQDTIETTSKDVLSAQNDITSTMQSRDSEITAQINTLLQTQQKVDQMTLAQEQTNEKNKLASSIYSGSATDSADKTIKAYNDANQTQQDYYQKQIDNINAVNNVQAEIETRLKNQNDLIQKQTDLQNIQNNKNVQVMTQKADGTWDYKYVADASAVESAQKAVQDQITSNNDWETSTAKQHDIDKLTALKTALADEKTAKDKAYSDQLTDLEATQKIETDELTLHYSDMNKLAETSLKDLKTTYGDNWDAIVAKITDSVTAITAQYDKLASAQAGGTLGSIITGDTTGDTIGNTTGDNGTTNTTTPTTLTPLDTAYDNALNAVVKANSSKSVEDIATAKEAISNLGNISDAGKSLEDTLVNSIVKFDRGGETGNWSGNGKLAILHPNEIINNPLDSSFLLKAMDASKSILSMLPTINMPSIPQFRNNGGENKSVTYRINEVKFDNATDKNEILSAFKSLPSVIAQMSS